jgi:pimeloyl-ACP methyl ester carboxylesterase
MLRRGIWAAGFVFVAIAMGFLIVRSLEVKPQNLPPPHYVTDPPWKKPLAIVFVHGIFGNDKTTWSSGNTNFATLLATDPVLEGKADVYLFEYYSPYLHTAGSIVQVSDQMSVRLGEVFNDHEHVIFVAHSMGGLIVREYLLNNRSRAAKVSMMYFFATPTQGVAVAGFGRRIWDSAQLADMIPIDQSTLLQSISSGWQHFDEIQHVPSYCSYETEDTYGITRIVPMGSAIYLCNQPYVGEQGTDHISIVKPKNRDAQPYFDLITAIKATMGNLTSMTLAAPPGTANPNIATHTNTVRTAPVSLHVPPAPWVWQDHYSGTVDITDAMLRSSYPATPLSQAAQDRIASKLISYQQFNSGQDSSTGGPEWHKALAVSSMGHSATYANWGTVEAIQRAALRSCIGYASVEDSLDPCFVIMKDNQKTGTW